MLLVRSYRTFAPLPVNTGGMFLWHYPHGCPHWALPSKFGLWGARTFLKLDAPTRNRLANSFLVFSLDRFSKGKKL